MLTAEVEMYWNSKQMEFFFTRAAVSRFLPMHTQAPYLVIDATLLSSSATLRVIMQSWITIIFISQTRNGRRDEAGC